MIGAAVEVAAVEGQLQAAAAEDPRPRHRLLAIERQAAADDPRAVLVDQRHGDADGLAFHLLAAGQGEAGGLGEPGGEALALQALGMAALEVADLAAAGRRLGGVGTGGLALGLGEAPQLLAAEVVRVGGA